MNIASQRPIQDDFYAHIPDSNGFIFLNFEVVVDIRVTMNIENISVCKRRDTYFRDSTLLIMQQGIVGLTSSNFDSPTNQNVCYRKVALE